MNIKYDLFAEKMQKDNIIDGTDCKHILGLLAIFVNKGGIIKEELIIKHFRRLKYSEILLTWYKEKRQVFSQKK